LLAWPVSDRSAANSRSVAEMSPGSNDTASSNSRLRRRRRTKKVVATNSSTSATSPTSPNTAPARGLFCRNDVDVRCEGPATVPELCDALAGAVTTVEIVFTAPLSPLLAAGGSAENAEVEDVGDGLDTGTGAGVLDGNGKDDDGGADKDVGTTEGTLVDDDANGALGASEMVGTPGSPGRLSDGRLSDGRGRVGKTSPAELDVGVPPPPKIPERNPGNPAMGRGYTTAT